MSDVETLPGYQFVRTVLEMLVEDKDQLQVDGRIDDLGLPKVLASADAAEGMMSFIERRDAKFSGD